MGPGDPNIDLCTFLPSLLFTNSSGSNYTIFNLKYFFFAWLRIKPGVYSLLGIQPTQHPPTHPPTHHGVDGGVAGLHVRPWGIDQGQTGPETRLPRNILLKPLFSSLSV